MKLFHNIASPFVRKVRMVAALKGLTDQIDIVDVTVSPVSPDDGVNQCNPLGKIPALQLDNGDVLYDSAVIVEYLDAVGSGDSLIPAGDARWADMRLQALASGMCDAAIMLRYESAARPAEKQWDVWMDNQWLKVERSLNHLQSTASELSQNNSVGTIALACALAYLDFRYEDKNWRNQRADLAEWFAEFSNSEIFKSTAA
jgi:glutathione S-transferase